LWVDVSNPSSFGFAPLGRLGLRVHTLDGAAIASVYTLDTFVLPRNSSLLRLSGLVDVDPFDISATSRFQSLLGNFTSGVDSRLQALVSSVSLPLYDGALRATALECMLPGLHSPMIERIAMEVDYAAAASSVVWGLGALEVGAYLLLHNVFNASIELRKMAVRAYKGDVLMATVDVAFDPRDLDYDWERGLSTIVLSPDQELLTDRTVPSKVCGPIPDVNAMLATLQAGGEALLDVEGTLTIAAGNLFLPEVHYRQVNVSTIEFHPPPTPPSPPAAPLQPAVFLLG